MMTNEEMKLFQVAAVEQKKIKIIRYSSCYQ